MNFNVLRAIFKRNFVSYFSSPTGYVFICVFVLLSSAAAFWPNDFFNNNLANLDQLSKYLPYIMLVFVPAITMSIWAEERRQGTDELLLTIPAGDFDVVLGKYLAAVAIFSVSLCFSMIANFIVLALLGNPDLGLYVGTYMGYWFVGLTMLAIGMVASFLTSNLTVGFVLGAMFNAPLAFSAHAEVILPQGLAGYVARWSAGEQFRSFQRGVVSISSMSYFVLLTAVMLYLSVVLIGRRHWRGGKDGNSLIGHFAIRTLALIFVACGVSYVFANHDMRLDVTSERLSSLSPATRQLIKDLKTEHPVQIEAYISPEMPTDFVKTKLDLISALTELASLGGDKIVVEQHIVENFSEAAADAQTRYGIESQDVTTKVRGAMERKKIIMGVALTCGLEKQVLPFIDKGTPVEYELVRSIATVAQQKRKRIGVVRTDAQLLGGLNTSTFQMDPDSLLIEELRKQYDVVAVDPSAPIVDDFDALLVAQPSSLPQESLDNLIHAIQAGQPVAVFEDPLPFPRFFPNAPGTSQPRNPQQASMLGGGAPPPKGDIVRLWTVLGVDMVGNQIIWQDYNPYKQAKAFFSQEWVFVDDGAFASRSTVQPFNSADEITSGLQQVLFPYPGSIRRDKTSQLKFTPLVYTGDNTGFIRYEDLLELDRDPQRGAGLRRSTQDNYVLAARIQGGKFREDKDAKEAGGEPAQEDAAPAAASAAGGDAALAGEADIHVVLVADIDCLASAFFFVRPTDQQRDENEVNFQLDNVTFVLNILDSLAGDERFIDVRSRRRKHRTLTKVEQSTDAAREAAEKESNQFIDDFNAAVEDEKQKFNEKISKIQNQKNMDPITLMTQVEMAREDGQRRLDTQQARFQKELDKNLEVIDSELSREIRKVQNSYKLAAVLIPPLPPLLLAAIVFFNRRSMEREGVEKSRLR